VAEVAGVERQLDLCSHAHSSEIRALVERDFHRKSTRGRKRHARFMEDYTTATTSEVAGTEPVAGGNPDRRDHAGERQKPHSGANPAAKPPACPSAFTDDEILPVFEVDLDLPHLGVAGVGGRNRFDQRSFYGQRISVDDLNYERPRICPPLPQGGPIWWAVWDLGLVTTRPIHGCHLVNQCPACKRRLGLAASICA
jgi:hypothetical protein